MGQDTSTNSAPALILAEGDPAALRVQIEQTRAELGDTVAALALRADVKQQARDRVRLLRQDARTRAVAAQRTAKEHPVPLAAVGVALSGLVVLRIARR